MWSENCNFCLMYILRCQNPCSRAHRARVLTQHSIMKFSARRKWIMNGGHESNLSAHFSPSEWRCAPCALCQRRFARAVRGAKFANTGAGVIPRAPTHMCSYTSNPPKYDVSTHTLGSLLFSVLCFGIIIYGGEGRIKRTKGITAPKIMFVTRAGLGFIPRKTQRVRERVSDGGRIYTHRLGVCQGAQVDWLPYGKHHTSTHGYFDAFSVWACIAARTLRKSSCAWAGYTQSRCFSHLNGGVMQTAQTCSKGFDMIYDIQ